MKSKRWIQNKGYLESEGPFRLEWERDDDVTLPDSFLDWKEVASRELTTVCDHPNIGDTCAPKNGLNSVDIPFNAGATEFEKALVSILPCNRHMADLTYNGYTHWCPDFSVSVEADGTNPLNRIWSIEFHNSSDDGYWHSSSSSHSNVQAGTFYRYQSLGGDVPYHLKPNYYGGDTKAKYASFQLPLVGNGAAVQVQFDDSCTVNNCRRGNSVSNYAGSSAKTFKIKIGTDCPRVPYRTMRRPRNLRIFLKPSTRA